MEKTVNLSIGGKVFNLAESAYEKLFAYLESIREYFSSYEDSEEILEDIEGRMAEHFDSKTKSKKQIIKLGDVEELIKSMGEIEDFESFEPDGEKGKSESRTKQKDKKLYRSQDDKIFGGVSAGLAAYLGFDALLVRIIFVVLTLVFNGFAILFYIVLWLVVPEATTTAQKIEMQGDSITLSKIEEEIKSRINSKKKQNNERVKKSRIVRLSKKLKRVIEFPFEVLKVLAGPLKIILQKTGPILSIFIGIIIILSASAWTVLLSFILGVATLNLNSPYVDFSVVEMLNKIDYYSFVFAGYVIVLVPLLLLLLLGVSLVKRKLMFHKAITIGLVAVWLIAIPFAGVVAFNLAPQIQSFIDTQREDQQTVTKEVEFADFSQIDTRGHYIINLTQSDEYKVELEAPAKEIDNLAISKTDNTLKLAKNSDQQLCLFCVSKKATVNISAPGIEKIKSSGKTELNISGFIQQELTLTFSGASSSKIENLEIETLTIQQSGASDLEISGTGTSLTVDLSGASDLDAFDFEVDTVEIRASGASDIKVNVQKNLSGRISGAGSVRYLGNPENITIEESGAASVVKQDQE